MASETDIKRKRLRLLQLKKRKLELSTIPPEQVVEPAPEMSLAAKLVGGANAAISGATLGLSDEITSGVKAAGEVAGDFIAGDDSGRGYSDAYAANMAAAKANREAFSKNMPATALGAEVIGGVVTGGLTGAKVLSSAAVKNSGRLAKTLAATSVGGVEGGVAGFASGDNWIERVSNAKSGATLGALLPLALSSMGSGTRILSDKFKLPEVKTTAVNKNQPPVNIAHPNTVRGRFMRDRIGPAFGGRGVYDRSLPYLRQAEEGVTTLNRRGAKVTEATRQAQRAQKAASELFSAQTKASGKASVSNAVNKIKTDTQAQIGDINRNYRKQMEGVSQPANLSDKAALQLKDPILTPQQKADILSGEWVSNGFNVVTARGKTFNVGSPDSVKRSVKSMFNNDPSLRRVSVGYADDFMEAYSKIVKKDGTVSGDNLMELRNGYARSTNKATDPLQRELLGRYKTKIDKMIQDGLTPDEKAVYALDKDAWDNFSNLRTATGKAKQKGGRYTPIEWLSSTTNRRASTGKGPQQEAADLALEQQKVLKAEMGGKIAGTPEKPLADAANSAARTQAANAAETVVQRGRTAKGNAVRGLDRAKAKVANVRAGMPVEKPHVGSQLGNTAILAAPFAAAGPTVAIPTAIGLANSLSGPGGSRFITGQWGDDLLNKASNAKVGGLSLADILRQGTAAGAVAGQTD